MNNPEILTIDINFDDKEDNSKRSAKFNLRGDRSMIANGKAYEPEITDLFCRWLRPGDCVIDVGANAGWFTCLASCLVGPTGSVHAFEPGPANFKLLSENVGLNNVQKNVLLNEVALSDVSVSRKFYLHPYGHGGHSLWKMLPNASEIDVRTETLDQQQFKKPIRILKIDTEGHEQRILEGASDLLSGPYAPDFIFAENHAHGLHAEGQTELSLRQFISRYRYICFLLPPHSYLPISLSPNIQVFSYYAINYLFVRESKLNEMSQVISIAEISKQL